MTITINSFIFEVLFSGWKPVTIYLAKPGAFCVWKEAGQRATIEIGAAAVV